LRPSLTMPTKSNVEETHIHDSYRQRIFDMVFSRYCEIFMSGLIILDVLLAFTELFIAAEYPACDTVEKYAISCCPAESSNFIGQIEFQRILSLSSGNNDENLCEQGLENSHYAAACDENDYPDGVNITEIILFSVSMLVLAIFIIEILLVMVALGVRQFFGNAFFVLDFCVIMFCVLEVVIFSLDDNVKESLSGVLMLFRLWRFVRIGFGIVKADETLDANFGRINELQTKNHKLKMLLMENNIEMPEKFDTAALN